MPTEPNEEGTTPNLRPGQVYWLSTLSTRPRVWAKDCVSAKRAIEAARLALRWTGKSIAVWEEPTHRMVWIEFKPFGFRGQGMGLESFVYVP